MTHSHYAWEQFQKLDFITFYLNETFVFFLTERKKLKLRHIPLRKRITKTETLTSGTYKD